MCQCAVAVLVVEKARQHRNRISRRCGGSGSVVGMDSLVGLVVVVDVTGVMSEVCVVDVSSWLPNGKVTRSDG